MATAVLADGRTSEHVGNVLVLASTGNADELRARLIETTHDTRQGGAQGPVCMQQGLGSDGSGFRRERGRREQRTRAASGGRLCASANNSKHLPDSPWVQAVGAGSLNLAGAAS